MKTESFVCACCNDVYSKNEVIRMPERIICVFCADMWLGTKKRILGRPRQLQENKNIH